MRATSPVLVVALCCGLGAVSSPLRHQMAAPGPALGANQAMARPISLGAAVPNACQVPLPAASGGVLPWVASLQGWPESPPVQAWRRFAQWVKGRGAACAPL